METATAPPGFIQDQQGQVLAPPMMVSQQQAAGSHYSSGGHVGPVIAVLAVIAVLGILAGLLGRLCSGRTILGYGPHFDLESWVETKCSACLDGHVAPPRHGFNHMHTHMAMETLPTAVSAADWRPPEHISMRRISPPHGPPRGLQPPQQTAVQMRPENVSIRPNRPVHGLQGEVLLRPLPSRQVSLSNNVGENVVGGRVESEITTGRVQEEQVHQQKLKDDIKDSDMDSGSDPGSDVISDSSCCDHDDEHDEQQYNHHQPH